jgi:hypothetical protein
MESNYQRQIRTGLEFDKLFPKAAGNDRTILKEAGVDDTLQLIRKTVPQTLADTEAIAKLLRGKNLYDTCHKIWDFVYNHIQYKKDKAGVEQVRRPRRVWANRHTGVDCDCYTEFISSILTNLGIAHKLRIAVYNEMVGYQHIYPVVPKNGKTSHSLENREDYIVIDCVKDEFDSEQAFLKIKDYDMKLDYLDGLEEREAFIPATSDARELAELYNDEQELGNWWTKLTNTNGLKRTLTKVGKAVEHTVNQAVHFVDRYINPATILLRNGFLASMKLNLMNVAHKLRYAYLTDDQAKAKNMNLDALNHLRNIKNKAETIYWQAGGLKENLKKAILSGKGNKDGQVPMNGLDGLGEIYADQDEYDIVNMPVHGIEGIGDLGEPVTLTAIGVASAAVATLSATIKQITGLFKTGGTEQEKQFNSDKPDPVNDSGSNTPTQADLTTTNSDGGQNYTTTNPDGRSSVPPGNSGSAQNAPILQSSGQAPNSQSLVPAPAGTASETPSDPAAPVDPNAPAEGFFTKAGTWIKTNPMPSLAIGGVTAGMAYMFFKDHNKGKKGGLHGFELPGFHKKHRKTTRAKPKAKARQPRKTKKQKVKAFKI